MVKQVRESIDTRKPRVPSLSSESVTATGALSSPNLTYTDTIDDIQDYDMAVLSDLSTGTSSHFKQYALKNPKMMGDAFSESSSVGGALTTPPPLAFLPLESSSGLSEDAIMDSPLPGRLSRGSVSPPARNICRSCTAMKSFPQKLTLVTLCNQFSYDSNAQGPSAADYSWRFNNKRRRDDDFDPMSFKRRAVSPGMSVHNSPIPHSPLQRDSAPWGTRAGSAGGERGGSSALSDAGSVSGGNSVTYSAGTPGRQSGKGMVGLQGMVDTNDGIMRMSMD